MNNQMPSQDLPHSTLRSDNMTGGPTAHNHRRIRHILEEQGIGPIERLLLWLAKTDLYVLYVVPNSCRVTLVSLGLMVVFTATLAFGSAFYTASTMVVSPDTPGSYLIAGAIALVYAFGIMVIDREIVGSSSWVSLGVRVVFAVGIAFAVSWPVKIKLFEGRINQELIEMAVEQQRTKIDERNDLKLQAQSSLERLMNERAEQRRNLLSRLDSLRVELATLDDSIAAEADVIRCGPQCQKLRDDKREVERRAERIEEELESLSGQIAMPEEVQVRIDQLQREIAAATDSSRVLSDNKDILSKWEAKERLRAKMGPGFDWLDGFVTFFFMLLEMVPLALKWSLGKTEYQYYMEARSNLNNQKIVSLANFYIERMQRNRESIGNSVPPEITDMMAWLIEDESREHQPRFDPRTLAEIEEEVRGNLKRRSDGIRPESVAPATHSPGPASSADSGASADVTITEDPPPQAQS